MFNFLLNIYFFVVIFTNFLCVIKGNDIKRIVYDILKEKDEEQAKRLEKTILASCVLISFIPILNITDLVTIIVCSCASNGSNIANTIINELKKEMKDNQ